MEAVNKIIKRILKTHLDELKKMWADELPDVMWSYLITHQTSKGEIPFALAYGAEAIPTNRVLNFGEQLNEEALVAELDFLDERRLNADAKNAV